MLGHGALGQYAVGEVGDPRGTSFERAEFTFVGNSVRLSRSMVAGVGAFTLAGNPIIHDVTFDAGTGAFALSGSATLAKGYRFEASGAVVGRTRHFLFAPLGAAALGEIQRSSVSATTFVLVGATIDATRGIGLGADAGSFAWTGLDTTLSLVGYPTNIRIFPRVGRGVRAISSGRSHSYTNAIQWDGQDIVWNGAQVVWTPRYRNPILWNGSPVLWDGGQIVWNGELTPSGAVRGGIIVRTRTGRGLRARAFGG